MYCPEFSRIFVQLFSSSFTELVLGKIYHELRKLHVNQSLGARNLPDLVDGTVSGGNANDLTAVEVEARLSSNVKDRDRGSRRKRKHSPDEVSGAAALSPSEESCASPIDPLSDLYAVLEGSALIPFLESKLQANSFLEICNHATVYRYVVYIIKELGNLLFIMVILNVNRYFNESVFVRKKAMLKHLK